MSQGNNNQKSHPLEVIRTVKKSALTLAKPVASLWR